MSFCRSDQLRELQQIIENISREIMWVNEREEEELVFDWGDRNIDQYVPKKQESYSVRTGEQLGSKGEGHCCGRDLCIKYAVYLCFISSSSVFH